MERLVQNAELIVRSSTLTINGAGVGGLGFTINTDIGGHSVNPVPASDPSETADDKAHMIDMI